MKLYRGYQQRPRFLTPEMEKEWDGLSRMKESFVREGGSMLDVLQKMGVERMTRWGELAQVAGPQFFTDQEVIAREFAGDKGFVIALDVPDDVARNHYRGEHLMNRGGENRYSSNAVFSGVELATHLADWKFHLTEIEREDAEGEKETSDHSETDAARKGLFREDYVLTEHDREALAKLRRLDFSDEGTKSSGPEGGSMRG